MLYINVTVLLMPHKSVHVLSPLLHFFLLCSLWLLSLFSSQAFVDVPWKHQVFDYADVWKFCLENSQISAWSKVSFSVRTSLAILFFFQRTSLTWTLPFSLPCQMFLHSIYHLWPTILEFIYIQHIKYLSCIKSYMSIGCYYHYYYY